MLIYFSYFTGSIIIIKGEQYLNCSNVIHWLYFNCIFEENDNLLWESNFNRWYLHCLHIILYLNDEGRFCDSNFLHNYVKCCIKVFFWICNFNFSKSISPKNLIKIILCIEKAYICMRKFLCCDFRYFFSYVINKIKIPIPAMLIQAFLPPNWGCNVLFLDFAKRLID